MVQEEKRLRRSNGQDPIVKTCEAQSPDVNIHSTENSPNFSQNSSSLKPQWQASQYQIQNWGYLKYFSRKEAPGDNDGEVSHQARQGGQCV